LVRNKGVSLRRNKGVTLLRNGGVNLGGISNMLGKLHQQITINNPFEQQLSLASIVDGIFIVKLYVNNEVLDTQRLVITKN